MSDHTINDDSTNYDRITQYYQQTRWQYRGLWTGKHSLALHHGYWDEDVGSHVESLERMNYEIAKRAGIQSWDRILDAGCGWGGTSIWLAQHYDVTVIGNNIDPDQSEKANEKAGRFGVTDRTTFVVGDFHDIDEPDASLDVVLAIESVCHSTRKVRFAQEALRVLKSGGRLVVADYFRASRQLPPEDERLLRKWLSHWVVEDLSTIHEFMIDLRNTGFEDLEEEDCTSNIYRSAKRMRRMGMLTAPLALLFRAAGKLPFYTSLSHQNWRSSFLQFAALQRGTWRYRIVSAVRP